MDKEMLAEVAASIWTEDSLIDAHPLSNEDCRNGWRNNVNGLDALQQASV